MSDRLHVTGALTGQGAAFDVTKVGFRPRMVKVWNTAAGGLVKLEWNDAMPEGSGFKQKNDAAAQNSFLTADGITPLANGFTLGADADVNAAGEQLYYEAWD